RLRRASSAAHHDEARDAYAAVDAAHPGHRAQATVESRADLEDACTRGMLFDVMAGGEWAGYVAADVEGRRLGLPAYVVQELVLAPPFRGRGYGTALSTLLARALPDDDRPVLLGTVHPDNRGALCAAVAAGRVDVGGWFRIVL
ncbi:MAG: GNAT family N-acetyltransferase, partial [Pseudonocardia sp.]